MTPTCSLKWRNQGGHVILCNTAVGYIVFPPKDLSKSQPSAPQDATLLGTGPLQRSPSFSEVMRMSPNPTGHSPFPYKVSLTKGGALDTEERWCEDTWRAHGHMTGVRCPQAMGCWQTQKLEEARKFRPLETSREPGPHQCRDFRPLASRTTRYWISVVLSQPAFTIQHAFMKTALETLRLEGDFLQTDEGRQQRMPFYKCHPWR